MKLALTGTVKGTMAVSNPCPLVGRGAVDFDAPDLCANLMFAAALEAADAPHKAPQLPRRATTLAHRLSCNIYVYRRLYFCWDQSIP
jgi:hypothetical protein